MAAVTQIPGFCVVTEAGEDQYQIPGMAYFNAVASDDPNITLGLSGEVSSSASGVAGVDFSIEL